MSSLLNKYKDLFFFLFSFVQVATYGLRDLCVNKAHRLYPKDFRISFASSPVKANRADEGEERFVLTFLSFFVNTPVIILDNSWFYTNYNSHVSKFKFEQLVCGIAYSL